MNSGHQIQTGMFGLKINFHWMTHGALDFNWSSKEKCEVRDTFTGADDSYDTITNFFSTHFPCRSERHSAGWLTMLNFDVMFRFCICEDYDWLCVHCELSCYKTLSERLVSAYETGRRAMERVSKGKYHDRLNYCGDRSFYTDEPFLLKS